MILRVFSLFLCPLSMTPGYISFLLQSLGGASVTQKALRSATTVRGRSDWLRAQPEAEVIHAHGHRPGGVRNFLLLLTSMQNHPSVNHGPRLPMFSESKDELDSYLQRFERYAVNERWPRDSYALNLASLSTGKALNVYSRLPLALANDYDILKKALLQQYQLTVDDYRKKCYPRKQNADKNATQYVSRLEHFLNSWIQLSEISETFESLKEFLLQD